MIFHTVNRRHCMCSFEQFKQQLTQHLLLCNSTRITAIQFFICDVTLLPSTTLSLREIIEQYEKEITQMINSRSGTCVIVHEQPGKDPHNNDLSVFMWNETAQQHQWRYISEL